MIKILSYNQTENILKLFRDGQEVEYHGISPFRYEKLRKLVSKKNWNSADRLLNSWKQASVALDVLKLAKEVNRLSFKEAVMILGSKTASEEVKEEAEEVVKGGLLGALKKAIPDAVRHASDLAKTPVDVRAVSNAVWKHVKGKLNIRQTIRDLVKQVGEKGWKMGVVAVVLEIFEDIVLPGIAIAMDAPGLVPIFLTAHFEPIVYPIAWRLLGTK